MPFQVFSIAVACRGIVTLATLYGTFRRAHITSAITINIFYVNIYMMQLHLLQLALHSIHSEKFHYSKVPGLHTEDCPSNLRINVLSLVKASD
jgi:hypothetical protein